MRARKKKKKRATLRKKCHLKKKGAWIRITVKG